MAITSTSAIQSATTGLWVEMQRQIAQRNVDQAEQRASALQAKAQEAQSVAERARENARTLNSQASQAQGEAGQARQGLARQTAGGEIQAQLTGLHEQIVDLLGANSPIETSALPPVINASGQTTGSLINVTA